MDTVAAPEDFSHGSYGDYSGVVFYGPPADGFWFDRIAISDRFIRPLFLALINQSSPGSEKLPAPKLVQEWNTLVGWVTAGTIVEIRRPEIEELISEEARSVRKTDPNRSEIHMIRLMVTLGAASLLAFTAGAGDATKQDQQVIQGKWRVTEITKAGKKNPPDAGASFVFTVEKWQLLDKGKVDKEGKFTLDATKKPKTIVVYQGETQQYGIYVLEKDTLRICLSAQGKKQPPAELASTAENGNTLATFERLKK